MDVKNKRVVVTGAASGIGKALCEAFHEADAQSIVAVDMNLDGAQETADSVNGIAVQANVGNEKDIINVIQKQMNMLAAQIFSVPMQELGVCQDFLKLKPQIGRIFGM
jgi:NAD(P)-dependent dehydrogenase (short-subunit alcohol dehydrogenase family)